MFRRRTGAHPGVKGYPGQAPRGRRVGFFFGWAALALGRFVSIRDPVPRHLCRGQEGAPLASLFLPRTRREGTGGGLQKHDEEETIPPPLRIADGPKTFRRAAPRRLSVCFFLRVARPHARRKSMSSPRPAPGARRYVFLGGEKRNSGYGVEGELMITGDRGANVTYPRRRRVASKS